MINSKKVMAAAPVAACKKTTTEKDTEKIDVEKERVRRSTAACTRGHFNLVPQSIHISED